MYPPLLGLFPDIGRSLLTYRVERIPEAKLKALSYDPPYAGGELGVSSDRLAHHASSIQVMNHFRSKSVPFGRAALGSGDSDST